MSVRLVQSALPPYRAAFLSELARRLPDLEVYVGSALFEETVRTATELPLPVTRITNVFLARRRLLWQRGVVAAAVHAEVAVLELNPRILNVWVTLVVRRFLRRPTILWGHAWPRRGRGSSTDRLRSFLRRRADVIITYTEKEAGELRAAMPGRHVLAAPNAIYREGDMHADLRADPDAFLYVGRLVPEKKPLLLVEAFALASPRLGATRLILVGAGPEDSKLVARVAALGIERRVDFVGALTDSNDLRALYSRALASVSPGYVGLSLIQSLAFGVPMIVADAEAHSPEIEAAVEGVTARFFAADSASDLARTLIDLHQQQGEWLERRSDISAWCRRRYSAERMADGFVDAIRVARARANRMTLGVDSATEVSGDG